MTKVLLVDDEVSVSSIFDTALTKAGFEVKLAPDGKSGLEMAKQGTFDVILLDQMMTDMSGNEVLKALKADDATKGIKVAMLTNFGHDTLVKEALFAGADDYILKYEISPEDLVVKVKRLLGQA